MLASQELRSSYISLHRKGAKATTLLVQHNRAIVAPTEDWGAAIDTGRPDIKAWRIGDFRDSDPFLHKLMAVGHGRTVALRYFFG